MKEVHEISSSTLVYMAVCKFLNFDYDFRLV
jgi:hypothetical protein